MAVTLGSSLEIVPYCCEKIQLIFAGVLTLLLLQCHLHLSFLWVLSEAQVILCMVSVDSLSEPGGRAGKGG